MEYAATFVKRHATD